MFTISARAFAVAIALSASSLATTVEQSEPLAAESAATAPTRTYWEYVSPISPAMYEPKHGDFLAEFTSPNGKQVRLVVKAPVITTEYDVPPIGKKQTAFDYLNGVFYDASGNPRTSTYIKLPKATYDIDFPLNSSCSLNYVHWQLPLGATDLIVDGQGSTVNFSDFCLGLNLPNVTRVLFKNFTFAWPNLQIATVANITAVGGNGTTGYTYDVHIPADRTARLPNVIAAANVWDDTHHHWDTADTNAVFYGSGFPAGSGVPLTCEESAAQQKTAGCTAKGITSYGVQFKVGQSILLRHYDYAAAVTASGNDVTFDRIKLENIIGTGFGYSQGRGLRIAHSSLVRMAGEPISTGGNGSIIVPGVSGDIAFEDDGFGYTGDDPFDLNSPLIRFTSIPVTNNTNTVNGVSTPMNTYTFDSSTPADQLQWPAAFGVQSGDTIALFSHDMKFEGTAKAASVTPSANGSTSVIVLDRNVSSSLRQAGFIATDLTTSGGARYLIRNSGFVYTSGRALLLQTPFGLVSDNLFVGQTQRQVYVLASQYWGEGAGAQELTITHNTFDATGNHQAGFFALDVMAESTDFFTGVFPNDPNEVAGTKTATPAVNQGILVTDNTFTSDRAVPLVNLSSLNNATVSRNAFIVPSDAGAGSFPVTIHDASNIHFDETNRYSSWLAGASCADSPLLQLSDPPPAVKQVLPNACGIEGTVSGLSYQAPLK